MADPQLRPKSLVAKASVARPQTAVFVLVFLPLMRPVTQRDEYVIPHLPTETFPPNILIEKFVFLHILRIHDEADQGRLLIGGRFVQIPQVSPTGHVGLAGEEVDPDGLCFS